MERWQKIACKALLFFQWYKKLFCPGGSVRCFMRLLNLTPRFPSHGNFISSCNYFVFKNLFAYNVPKCLGIRETLSRILCSQNAPSAVEQYCSKRLHNLHNKIKKALKITGRYPNVCLCRLWESLMKYSCPSTCLHLHYILKLGITVRIELQGK